MSTRLRQAEAFIGGLGLAAAIAAGLTGHGIRWLRWMVSRRTLAV